MMNEVIQIFLGAYHENIPAEYVTAYGVVISLFVVSMIVWFMSGDGDDDD